MRKFLSAFARDAESDEEYAVAAAAFFALGAYLFADELYRNGRSYREGIGYLLRSIELDARTETVTRAERTAAFLQENTAPVVADGNEPVVRGLGYEWAGDSLLIIGDDAAVTQYQSAIEQFDRLDLDTQLYWGASPEYDTAFLPMKRFFERRGVAYFDRHDIDFAERVDWKLERCDELLE